jgi:hypothetical protein
MIGTNEGRLPGFGADLSLAPANRGYQQTWDGGAKGWLGVHLADNICSGGGGECHCSGRCHADQDGCRCLPIAMEAHL